MDAFYFIKITKLYVIEFLRTINNTLKSKEKKRKENILFLLSAKYRITLYLFVLKIYLLK